MLEWTPSPRAMHDRPWFQHYDPGVPRKATFENLTLPQFLERAAAAHPDTIAVVFLNGRLRYRELKDQVDRLATALAALGVAKDQRVADRKSTRLNSSHITISY